MSNQRWLKRPPHREKGKCSWCLAPVPKGRKSWCSQACVDEYLIRSGSDHVRSRLLKRDHGVCACCGIDCLALEKDLHRYRRLCRATCPREWTRRQHFRLLRKPRFERRQVLARWRRIADAFCARIKEDFVVRGLPLHLSRKSVWDADHIVEVAEGGGLCGLDNYQTLCLKCHQDKTNRLVDKLTIRRREDRTGQLEMRW